MPVRMGVIGVGYLGRHHARIYADLPGVELVGVADDDPARADEVARTYSCRAFRRYTDLVSLCDAVSIVTPTTTHHRVGMDCLAAGKDVLIEKPITQDLSEAQEIVAAADAGRRILQVGHLERYNPGVVAAAGMIGQPWFVESERLSPFLGRGIDVDVTLDLMIHDIDIVIGLIHSRIRDIRAVGASVITDKIDIAKAWLEFDNGCKALITASRLAPDKQRTLKVFQKDSFIAIDYQNQDVRRHYKAGNEMAVELVKPESREPLREELADFIGCVRERRRPLVSGIEGMDALAVALRITAMLNGEAGSENTRMERVDS